MPSYMLRENYIPATHFEINGETWRGRAIVKYLDSFNNINNSRWQEDCKIGLGAKELCHLSDMCNSDGRKTSLWKQLLKMTDIDKMSDLLKPYTIASNLSNFGGLKNKM